MKGAAASKREISLAFSAVQAQARAFDAVEPILQSLAHDNGVTKALLCRPFWGRLKWLLLGR